MRHLLSFSGLERNHRARKAEEVIYDAPIPSERRADILTSMTILSGLVSDRLPLEILSRRRDMMIESAGYHLIKQDGILEGIQQGIQQGQLTSSREALMDLLIERFDIVPEQLFQGIDRLDNLFTLKALRKNALKASSIDIFERDMNRMMQ